MGLRNPFSRQLPNTHSREIIYKFHTPQISYFVNGGGWRGSTRSLFRFISFSVCEWIATNGSIEIFTQPERTWKQLDYFRFLYSLTVGSGSKFYKCWRATTNIRITGFPSGVFIYPLPGSLTRSHYPHVPLSWWLCLHGIRVAVYVGEERKVNRTIIIRKRQLQPPHHQWNGKMNPHHQSVITTGQFLLLLSLLPLPPPLPFHSGIK